jgi:transcriptional regulator with XRE-family HTH domain
MSITHEERGTLENNVLRELRTQRGWSQERLALISGVPGPSVTRFETGERLITADAAEKMAGSLGVDSLALSLAHNLAVLKQRMDDGREGPGRAGNLARTLLETLERNDLTDRQAEIVAKALEALQAMIRTSSHSHGGYENADSGSDYEAQMLALGRDVFGRKLRKSEVEKRRREKGLSTGPVMTEVEE